ncbi:phosphotransferase (plasmid) [Rhodococcus pyridinivorans]|nr:phosphotransferase [Rhodococcus pyridinivorans]
MHASDLNSSWVQTALRLGANPDSPHGIESIEFERIGTGQVADSYHVSLTYRDPDSADGPRSLVAKFTSDSEQSRGAGRTELNYLREVRFYQQIAPQLHARVPHCHYSEIDSNNTEFVLLLEDLTPARAGNQLVGCTVDETARALEQAAGFHAPYWGGDDLRGLEWLDISETYWKRFEEMMPVWFEGFAERYNDRIDPEDLRLAGKFVAHIGDYYARLRRAPFTIQHGDFRPDNILFDVQGEAGTLAVVDWQTVILGPGAVDVAYFIGGALDTDTRRAHEDELLRGYHRKLLELGVKDYSLKQLSDEYAAATFANLIIGVAAAMLVERSERGDELFVSMVTSAVAHARDRKGLAAIGASEVGISV